MAVPALRAMPAVAARAARQNRARWCSWCRGSSTVLAEILVDSSGLYRFEDIAVGRSGGRYQIWRYANGILTESPEIEAATFSVLPGQLPSQASALIVSGGFAQRSSQSFLGSFDQFQGGIGYRRGINESLTLGAGLAFDQSPLATADAFWASKSLPLKAAVSIVVDATNQGVDWLANLQLKPSDNWQINLDSDRFSHRFDSTWRVMPGLSLKASGNTRDEAIAGGGRFALKMGELSLQGSGSLDSRLRRRWNLSAQTGALSLRNSGSEVATQSELWKPCRGNIRRSPLASSRLTP